MPLCERRMLTTVILVAWVDLQRAAPTSSEMRKYSYLERLALRRVLTGAKQQTQQTHVNSTGGIKMAILLIRDLSLSRPCAFGGTMLARTLTIFSEPMARC